MQRPSIPPSIKPRRQFNSVEASRDVTDDPEDQPQRRPRLPDRHRDVLARQPERDHADEVDHPVDGEGAAAVGVRVLSDFGVRSGGVVEGDLEGQRYHRVGERQEEVDRDGGHPAPDDGLPEAEGGMAGWDHECDVDRHEEGEAEEGDDDQVDQADVYGRDGRGGLERAEIEAGEADCRTESLGCGS